MSQNVYYSFAHTQTRLENGENVVVNNEKELKNSDLSNLYAVLLKLKPTSIYEVGYRMGATLVSLRNLLPDTKLAGAEKEDLNSSYSQRLFKTWSKNISLEVRNFLDILIGMMKYEVVYTRDTLNNYSIDEQKKIIGNMSDIADKYIIIAVNLLEKVLIDFLIELGWSLISSENNIYVFQKNQKVENNASISSKSVK